MNRADSTRGFRSAILVLGPEYADQLPNKLHAMGKMTIAQTMDEDRSMKAEGDAGQSGRVGEEDQLREFSQKSKPSRRMNDLRWVQDRDLILRFTCWCQVSASWG